MAPPPSAPDVDVLCVGEAMVVLTPADGQPLRAAESFLRTVGGAEFNVALTLARLGVRTAWLSRLGTDGFGDHVLDVARAHQVEVETVERDPDRPTGLYVKAPGHGPDGAPLSVMHYYRSGSAASALTSSSVRRPEVLGLLDAARFVHVSGITVALSDGSAEAVDALVGAVAARPATRLVVDLNFRPTLWRGRSTTRLEELLDAADEVLLGADEALDLLGTDEPRRLGALLPRAERILIKRGGDGVQVVEDGGVVADVPALPVSVVEPVGAGDAFAAGYLAGRCRDLDLPAAVRVGHVCAAATLGVLQDRPATLPSWTELLRLVDAAGPGGSTAPTARHEPPVDLGVGT